MSRHSHSSDHGTFPEVKSAVRNGVQELAEHGRDMAQSVKSAASDTFDGLRKDAVAQTEQLSKVIAARPLTSMAVAAGAGALLAAAFMWRRAR